MKNYILRYGLVGGIVSITLGLVNWFTIARVYGPTASQSVGYLSVILSLMCIPLGILYFRDKLNGGSVSFTKGFSIGLGITFVFSIVTFLYSLLFFEFAGDSYQEWIQQGLTEAELQELQLRMEQTPDFVHAPWFQGLIFFLTVFMIGMVINLISSLALKRS